MPADPSARAGARLTVDLAAIQENYRRLCDRLGGIACGAVVKGDAYGLGLAEVAPALFAAGARVFFTALPDEAIALRALLPEAEIYVLDGLLPGAEADYRAHGLRPVLNSLEEIERHRACAGATPLPAALHVDSGMSRLGLPDDEVAVLRREPDRLAGVELSYLLSHLACADTPAHPMNAEQLHRFRKARAALPPCRASLANSSGIFLGPAYHFDLARPGVALFGANPTPEQPNPMAQVVRLQGKILQVREIDALRSVGYGAAFRAARSTRVATVAIGYADGYLRSLSGRGRVWLGAAPLPVLGRVSMDLITVDASDLEPGTARPGEWVDIIGPREGVDEVANKAGTIGYEILTSLGHRFLRVYTGGRS